MGAEGFRGPSGVGDRAFTPAATGGRPVAPALGATVTPWVLDLIVRFRDASGALQICEHLADDRDDGAVWSAAVPDLRSCRRSACTEAVTAVREERLGHPLRDEPNRCTTCGTVGVEVRGVGVAVGPTMLRGTVCGPCLNAKPVPTPPVADLVRETAGRLVETDEDPLAMDAEALDVALADAVSTTPDGDPFDELGRRAIRRGGRMAEACTTATRAGLDRERSVVGGLLVLAARLAEGLSGPTRNERSPLHDLAFRALVETTVALRSLMATPSARESATTGGATTAAGGTAPGIRTDGRPRPEGAARSWSDLAAQHVSERPDGFALDLERRGIGPMEALVAGEQLALACADYVDRMPTNLDPDDIRRLADEVTRMRAIVEIRFAEAVARGRGSGGGAA